MVKIISITKEERKQDSKGENCINYQCKVIFEGKDISTYLTSYGGQINPGDSLDISLEQKTSQKTGKNYWNGYWRPTKENITPVHHETIIPQSKYTPEELQGVMEKCVVFVAAIPGIEKAGININTIINTLFMSHTSSGHRPNDWTKPIQPAEKISAENETLLWAIGDMVTAKLITEQDVKATIQIVAKKPAKFKELTIEQAKEVFERIKKQIAAKDLTADTDFDPTPVTGAL